MTQETDYDIGEWLRSNAIPVQITRADDFSDLHCLREILRSVRVVGLAECTHGTREFFQIRHRILQFLVEEMGFTALAIEASYSDAERVNAFVMGEHGDLRSALSGLGFVMWDVEEFADVLIWMRAYNAGVEDARRVRFYGVDIWNTRASRVRVLQYLRVVAPERVSSVAEAFQRIADAEARGLLRAHEGIDRTLWMHLQDLTQFLANSRESFVAATSAREYSTVRDDLTVILQSLTANLSDELAAELPSNLPVASKLNNYARSMYMAQNLIQIMQSESPDMRVVVWAHVFHLGIGYVDAAFGLVPTMGRHLKDHFGDRYYVFGMELNEGVYLARDWLPDDTLGDFKLETIPRAPPGSVAHQLFETNIPSLILDARGVGPIFSRAAQWLRAPQLIHAVSWCHRRPLRLYTTRAVADAYDGIIFVAKTTPTTPTENARRAVAERSSY